MHESYTCDLPQARENQQIPNSLRSVAFCALLLLALKPGICRGGQEPANDPTNTYAGDSTCASCHRSIYESYQKTVMAHASGPIAGNVIPGEFTHAASHVHYMISEDTGHVWLAFEREGPNAVKGKRELLFFIGSGTRGRTYVFEDSGFYFESPVNWYGQKRVWDMTPAYQNAQHIPLNLPLMDSCLVCHTSFPQEPAAGTKNKYTAMLVQQTGIACERCHGPGAAHASGRGTIVNPAKLAPERRDSVCMQCHLEGDAAILQPGRHLSDFRPGDDLQDYVHYFLLNDPSRKTRAANQFEALAESQCKRKTGRSFSCITCHDPHFEPSAEEKNSYYNQKCVACHGGGPKGTKKHFAGGRDCVGCHMPRLLSSDIAHTQATDHRILRGANVAMKETQPAAALELRRFPENAQAPSNRDLALAWEGFATSGMEAAQPEVDTYVKRALAENPQDAEVLTVLGFLMQKRRNLRAAGAAEEQALKADPLDSVAESNLGILAAQSGELEKAERLLRDAFERVPGTSAIGMNLAKTLAAEGKVQDARRVVERVLEFNPDYPEGEQMLQALGRATH